MFLTRFGPPAIRILSMAPDALKFRPDEKNSLFRNDPFSAAAVYAQSFEPQFDERYERNVQFLNRMPKLVSGEQVRPVWKDAGSFLFSIHEGDSTRVYEVNIAAKMKSLASQAEFDTLRRRMRDWYYDPSDESQYAMHRS